MPMTVPPAPTAATTAVSTVLATDAAAGTIPARHVVDVMHGRCSSLTVVPRPLPTASPVTKLASVGRHWVVEHDAATAGATAAATAVVASVVVVGTVVVGVVL